MSVILVIDDDPRVRSVMRQVLLRLGHTVDEAEDATVESERRAAADLVLLDLLLPGGSGVDLLDSLRRSLRVPVILCTGAREADGKPIEEFAAEHGATLLLKPFGALDLAAAVETALRSSEKPPRAP